MGSVFKKPSKWKVLKIILLNPWKSLSKYWPEYLIQKHIEKIDYYILYSQKKE